MIIYYSGLGSKPADPELVLREEANVMFSYANHQKKNKPVPRLRKVLKARKHAKK